jgi:hypothetical protein
MRALKGESHHLLTLGGYGADFKQPHYSAISEFLTVIAYSTGGPSITVFVGFKTQFIKRSPQQIS